MSAPSVCAYCRRHPVDARWRPFCSERCKMADLGRWLQGDYRVSDPADPPFRAPVVDDDEDDEAPS